MQHWHSSSSPLTDVDDISHFSFLRGESQPCHVVVYALPGQKPTTTSCLDLDERFDRTCADVVKEDIKVIHDEVDTVEETTYLGAGLIALILIFAIANSISSCAARRRAGGYVPASRAAIAGIYNGKNVLAVWYFR